MLFPDYHKDNFLELKQFDSIMFNKLIHRFLLHTLMSFLLISLNIIRVGVEDVGLFLMCRGGKSIYGCNRRFRGLSVWTWVLWGCRSIGIGLSFVLTFALLTFCIIYNFIST
jgi:hypothetical protein